MAHEHGVSLIRSRTHGPLPGFCFEPIGARRTTAHWCKVVCAKCAAHACRCSSGDCLAQSQRQRPSPLHPARRATGQLASHNPPLPWTDSSAYLPTDTRDSSPETPWISSSRSPHGPRTYPQKGRLCRLTSRRGVSFEDESCVVPAEAEVVRDRHLERLL